MPTTPKSAPNELDGRTINLFTLQNARGLRATITNLGGQTYQLPQNDGKNCLHGGPNGWQYRIFNVEEVGDNRLVLSLVSEDGDSGFPGNACARLESPVTGIVLEVYTTEPGMQVYTGNFLDGTVTGKYGDVYQQRAAVCLETQKFPDSPNQYWPESDAFLRPGEVYRSHTMFRFSKQ